MGVARKLFLLNAIALAVFALLTSAASAGVEIVDEDTDVHCGPCVVHVVSTSNFDMLTHAAVPGIEVLFSRCANELEAEIYEDGRGHIYSQSVTGPMCTMVPCSSTEWPLSLSDGGGIGGEALTVSSCFVRAGTQIACTATFAVDSWTHTVAFGGSDVPCVNYGGAIEVTGSWATEVDESHEAIEVVDR